MGVDESRLEEAAAFSAHGMMEEEAKLLSGDDTFLGLSSFTGLLLKSKKWNKLRIQVNTIKTLDVWYYCSRPADDSENLHLPCFYIWLCVLNRLRSVDPASILFQMTSYFCRLQYGVSVNNYNHRKPPVSVYFVYNSIYI